MSLDVYLRQAGAHPSNPDLVRNIWIREEGEQRALTRAEWEARYPGREPVLVVPEASETTVVFHANITHNLRAMAEAAGLSQALWRPEEQGWTTAQDLIVHLRQGIAALEATPDTFTPYAPANGWGTYGSLLAFCKRYLRACETWPAAAVHVSR